MRVQVDSWAWLPTEELGPAGVSRLKGDLTIQPSKPPDFPGPDPEELHLFTEEKEGHIGVPRQYFLQNATQAHQIDFQVTKGDTSSWPGPVVFDQNIYPLTDNQAEALHTVKNALASGSLGGILQAGCGWGKTVGALAIIAEMGVPTLITVHKSFLMKQWLQRINKFLGNAVVGVARQKKCDFKGKNIVLAMNDSLESRDYGEEFYNYFGLIVTDECHRAGAPTWSKIPPKFPAKWRLGLTATPRRSDRCERAFFYHIGNVLFKGIRRTQKAKVRRIYTDFELPQSRRMNASLLSRPQLVTLLCRSRERNRVIVNQIVLAVKAERKILVLSERLDTHLRVLEQMFQEEIKREALTYTTDFYIGGRKEEELELASEADVIFATSQYGKEGLDIPALDTIILATPMGDVEQAAGRILRDFPSKKEPIVVDIVDGEVVKCKKLAKTRWNFYQRSGWV